MLHRLFPTISFIAVYAAINIYAVAHKVSSEVLWTLPNIAILFALVIAWVMHNGDDEARTKDLVSGASQQDIITMCLLFLLASVFAEITKLVGSAEAIVNMVMHLVPSHFLLSGVFITSALMSTAIGTSMGTINTIGPIAHILALHGAFSPALALATVVGGAMFGDNISVVSDTTIAAISSQGADFRAKLRLNAKIAAIAAAVTVLVLLCFHKVTMKVTLHPYELILVLPYLFILISAIAGINVFVALSISTFVAIALGAHYGSYGFIDFVIAVRSGFSSVHAIIIFSILVGAMSGLSGLSGKGAELIANKLVTLLGDKAGARAAQLVIAKIVGIFDLLLANNTVAIIVSGKIAKEVAQRYSIPPHYSAVWLDTFSCVIQGIIPYGAQIMLASAITGVSPMHIVGKVYYCYALGIVALLHILWIQPKADDE